MAEPQTIRKRILMGIPLFKPDDRFLEALPKFVEECRNDYDVKLCLTKDTLVNSQNMIAEYFMANPSYDYLLITEDDHWGYKKEMLDALIEKDVEVASINYFSRHFPYYSCLMHEVVTYNEYPLFAGYHDTQGWRTLDLSGYALMLLKRSVFEKLERPFFRLNKCIEPDNIATDIDFCLRLKEKNIDIWGCFDYTLSHRDITPENRLSKFLDGMVEHRKEKLEQALLGKEK